jgi:hypothetical protein
MDSNTILILLAAAGASRSKGTRRSLELVAATSNALPWAGRLALTVSAHRSLQRERDVEIQQLSNEVSGLLAADKLTLEDLKDKPKLSEIVRPLLPALPPPH